MTCSLNKMTPSSRRQNRLFLACGEMRKKAVKEIEVETAESSEICHMKAVTHTHTTERKGIWKEGAIGNRVIWRHGKRERERFTFTLYITLYYYTLHEASF